MTNEERREDIALREAIDRAVERSTALENALSRLGDTVKEAEKPIKELAKYAPLS